MMMMSDTSVTWTWIWNVVNKLPIWGITSTYGDGGLVQATCETVDGGLKFCFKWEIRG